MPSPIRFTGISSTCHSLGDGAGAASRDIRYTPAFVLSSAGASDARAQVSELRERYFRRGDVRDRVEAHCWRK